MSRYKFDEADRIGAGSFGVVYRAQRDDGTVWAVKQLASEHAKKENVLARFSREVGLHQQLDHPNVLPIEAADVTISPPWFAMPLAKSTLLDAIEAGLDELAAVRIFRGIMAGVAHAHVRGVIHRDLKPENVMMMDDDEPRVSDFGLGKSLLSDGTTLTQTYVIGGTWPYAAPEQLGNFREADERSDIHALGKILQAMLTGRPPTERIGSENPPVPRKYRRFIEKCTEHLMDERYDRMEATQKAFEEAAADTPPARTPLEEAQELVDAWAHLGFTEEEDLAVVRKLHAHFEQYSQDEELLRSVVPTLPRPLVRQYCVNFGDEFKWLVEGYSESLSGGVVDLQTYNEAAEFYTCAWDVSSDPLLRRKVLTRLVALGPQHDQRVVREAALDILSGITESGEAQMAAEVLTASPAGVEWLRAGVGAGRHMFADPIRDALA